ncbi:MAG: hypothetical protein MZV64_18415 [Ignavibacteriales bacterium]|nr:hypothetical protein [Ignavibacteriales bacterium]
MLAPQLRDAPRRAQPDDPVQGEVRSRSAENVTAGLLNYPILQAADILVYKAAAVPGRRGPGPAPRVHPRGRPPLQQPLRRLSSPSRRRSSAGAPKVQGLDGAAKMSKSLRQRHRGHRRARGRSGRSCGRPRPTRPASAASDPGRARTAATSISYHALVTPEAERARSPPAAAARPSAASTARRSSTGTSMAVLDPIRERRRALAASPTGSGRPSARERSGPGPVARETLDGAKQLMGLPCRGPAPSRTGPSFIHGEPYRPLVYPQERRSPVRFP